MVNKNMKFPERMTIKSHCITIVPRYSEIDQGGVAHNSVYAVWFEMGRTELLRVNGMAYKDLEESGVLFVVARLAIKYHRPAKYDEKLQLETTCTNVTAAKIEHNYILTRCSDGVILADGSTTLACVTIDGKIRRIPEFMYPQREETIV
jgi:acyl-CoA thioester hydrolase